MEEKPGHRRKNRKIRPITACFLWMSIPAGVTGEFGAILHTEDGGKTWLKQECKDIVPVVTAKDWDRAASRAVWVVF